MSETNKAPLYQYLLSHIQKEPVPFHMPGHRMGNGLFGYFASHMGSFDLTEIPGTDNLHHPESVIEQAQQMAANALGADHTFFLIN